MQFIIFLFLTFFFKTFSIKTAKPKLCINCKHFIPDNDIGEYGKCLLFPRVDLKIKYLVNGIDDIDINQFYYCSTARSTNDMCGIEGKLYKKNKIIIKNDDD